MSYSNRLTPKPKIGLELQMYLAHRATNEIFQIVEVSKAGYVTIESVEHSDLFYLSRNQLKDYIITGVA